MVPLLTSEESRAADAYTLKNQSLSSEKLMEKAAHAVFSHLEKKFPKLKGTLGGIAAGKGNNGKDALLVKELAEQKGARTTSDKNEFVKCDWIIDGVFGTGLSREVDGENKSVIEAINSSGTYVLSIDIPSGLSSDTGRALGVAVKATKTVALGFLKRGEVTGEAGNYVGELVLENIGIELDPKIIPSTVLYQKEDAKLLPKRPKASHKGNFGHVYIWAGEKATEGAALLSALAALRSGAGLVTVIGDESLRLRLPVECMVQSYSTKLLEKDEGKVFVIGPGMGVTDKSFEVLKAFLNSENRLVLDADALTLLSQHEKESLDLLKKRREKGGLSVFTPHPKEAARLLGTETLQVEKNRYEAVEALQKKWGDGFILKGHGSLIRLDGKTYVVNQGDSGLSKGGTGDFLTGILAGVWAGFKSPRAIPFSVYAHGRASELATIKFGTSRSTLASDLALLLPDVFNELGL